MQCVRAARPQAEPSDETIARGKALVEAGDCASCHTADPAKPFAGGKRIDTPFGAIYCAQPDARPRHRDRRLERRGFLPRAALRHGARWPALLPGLPLPAFHQADPRRHSGDPRLSRTLAPVATRRRRRSCAFPKLPRGDAAVELPFFRPGIFDARPGQGRGLESRRLSGRGARPLRRLPHAEEHVRRRQRDQAFAGGGSTAGSRRGSMAPRAAG